MADLSARLLPHPGAIPADVSRETAGTCPAISGPQVGVRMDRRSTSKAHRQFYEGLSLDPPLWSAGLSGGGIEMTS